MAARKHMNAEDRMTPFLSQSKGEVTTDIPDGCQYSYGEPEQEKGELVAIRTIGARSGVGKKVSMV